jgi:hypothetical protein
MPVLSLHRWRKSAALLLASTLLVLGQAVTSMSAHAAPSTKYYTATVSPQTVDAGVGAQSFALTLTNCGRGTPGCSKTSQQTLGSADIQVDPAFTNVSATVSVAGWHIDSVAGGLIELRSDNNVDLSPGAGLVVSITADTPSGVGAYTWNTAVKQSNDFSGTGNNFLIAGPQPQVLVGFPDHLVFDTQPSTLQATTHTSTSPMCPPPSVDVVTANGTVVTVGSASVSVRADGAYGDPGLGGTTTASAASGTATFGALDCSSGLTASQPGSGYRLAASTTWTYGGYSVSLSSNADSGAFDVVQALTTCQSGNSCNATVTGKHTTVDVVASPAATVDDLEVAVGIDSLSSVTCLPFSPPAGLEIARVLVDHRDKTVTLTFDKTLVNAVPNNGTPLFTICMSAPWGDWVTASGTAPTYNTVSGEYEGVLPACSAAGLAPYNPCVSNRGKHAAAEIVTISIPYEPGRADPKLW